MDAIVGTRRVERPGYAWIAVGLQLFIGADGDPRRPAADRERRGRAAGPPAGLDRRDAVRVVAGARAGPADDERPRPAHRGCPDRRPPSAGAVADGCARRGPDDLDRGPGGDVAVQPVAARHLRHRRHRGSSSPCCGSGDRATSAASGRRRGSDDGRRSGPRPALPRASPPIIDGSEAVASIETRLSEVACAYPITPSTTMAADLPGGRGRRADRPVGNAAAVHRAGVRALVRVRGRGRGAGRRPGHQLHRRPGPDPDEGGPVRHRRQAPARSCSTSAPAP